MAGGDLSGVKQPTIWSLVILNAEGRRIAARYCNKQAFPNLEAEQVFEKELMKKASLVPDSSFEDVFELNEHLVVYKGFGDVDLFVTGSSSENELILSETLRTYEMSLDALLREPVDETLLLSKLESVLLAMDELIDQEGIILETDYLELAARVGITDGTFGDSIPLGEQTLSQALQAAKDQITRTILS